jgi:predicted nicotinamide N-methyase
MRHPPLPGLWQPLDIADRHFQLLNLDHPHVAAHVMDDINTGIKVYYDRRWQVTTRFCHFLLAEPAWVTDRTVLVLGAGVGLETLVIGSLCRSLYINDLSASALDLCARQLRQNRLTHFVRLPGRYEQLALPAVDLIVGCFLVYNRPTATAMQQFLARPTPPVLLVNDNMPVFRQLLRHTSRPRQALLSPNDLPCLLFADHRPAAVAAQA